MDSAGRLAAGSEVTVRLEKSGGRSLEYPGVVVLDDGVHVAVRAVWSFLEARDLGFAVFEPGDVFVEHYWRDRWYSVKEVTSADGTSKGWYCDVARPVRVEGRVLISDDLDLDLWASADGATILRLDEDEFAAGGLSERDPETASAALRALGDLERLAGERFAELDSPSRRGPPGRTS